PRPGSRSAGSTRTASTRSSTRAPPAPSWCAASPARATRRPRHGRCASASPNGPRRATAPETADGAAPHGDYPGAVTSPATAPDTPTTAEVASTPRPVLVVDFGAQYAQLIARRVREAKVYSEIVPHTFTVEQMLAKDPAAIILSGGPSSVYATGAPFVDPALFEAGVPVMGICYGFQAMAKALGGEVAQTGLREYGGTEV